MLRASDSLQDYGMAGERGRVRSPGATFMLKGPNFLTSSSHVMYIQGAMLDSGRRGAGPGNVKMFVR